jgi:mRNA interferase MazF
VLIAGNPSSAALADQVKSLDWVARKAKRKAKATPGEMAEVRAKIHALIDG